MATYSTIFVWEIPWTDEPGRLLSIRLQSQHNLATKLINYSSSPHFTLEWNLKPISRITVSTSEVICLINPKHPLKLDELATNSQLFYSITSSSHSPPVYKSLPLCTALRSALFSPKKGCSPTRELLNKANKSFLIYSTGFCFLTTTTLFFFFIFSKIRYKIHSVGCIKHTNLNCTP